MAEFVAKFRQGSTHRPLRCVAFTQTAAVDFPAEFPGGVTFKMVRGTTVITGAATGDAAGNLTYAWATHDLDIAGTYAAAFIGTDGSGKTETFPTAGNGTVIIEPTL
jgi:hypothetical protein